MKKPFRKPQNKQEAVEFAFKILCLVLVIAYYVLFFAGKYIYGEASIYHRAIYLFSGAADPNPWLRSLSLIFFILSISYVVRLVLDFIAGFLGKGRAILQLISSLIRYAAVIVLIFMILGAFHVDTVTLLVSAGVVSLVIGLGAQSLISDVIAGLFIVFESTFEIGDIIVIDDFRGTVKEIGIRTTKIEDWSGNIKVVNNSDIRTLVNMTSELSMALVDVDIDYGESLEHVEVIIRDNLKNIKEAIPDIVDGPFYLGVSKLGESGVTLRFIAQCKETARFQVERDINRQLKLLFDKHNITIPFPQVTVNQPVAKAESAKKDGRKAQEFVDEQKNLTKDYPIENQHD